MAKRKPRRGRRFGVRAKRRVFLIVCEGTSTEPKYFKTFRASTRVIETGKSPHQVVSTALQRKEDAEYDEVWCVFDKDDFSSEEFNGAVELAERNGCRVAYSNECFELWFVLHFSYHVSASTRQQYRSMLTGLLGKPYAKTDPSISALLRSRVSTAMAHAQRLREEMRGRTPADANPSTSVHELVQALLTEEAGAATGLS